jgi:hypothetical protein
MPKTRPERLLKRLLSISFCASLTTLGCQTPSPEWNGTWKLNPKRSGFQGNVLTISMTADGEYRFDESSSHTLRCDGKEQAIGNNRTLVCVKSGATVLDIAQKENGVKRRATHDEISADGKVFTTTVTEFRPTGPVITSQIMFSRLSGSDGFAGRWQDTSFLQWHTDLSVRVDNQTLHIEYPSGGENMDLPLDGAEASVRGPHALEGDNTRVARPSGNREFLIVTKRNGKVFSQGSLVLSSDGSTITDIWWNPDRPDDKATLVYDKK